MNAYLGAMDAKGTASAQEPVQIPEGGIQAGLLIINDTTAPGSAPSLSPEAFSALSEGIRVQIMNAVPITFVKVLDNTGITPRGNSSGASCSGQAGRVVLPHDCDFIKQRVRDSNLFAN